MAECSVVREVPIPQHNPIKEVTLTLSLEEACIIRTILANISVEGRARELMAQVASRMYSCGISFVMSKDARILQGDLKFTNDIGEYSKFLEIIKKF